MKTIATVPLTTGAISIETLVSRLLADVIEQAVDSQAM